MSNSEILLVDDDNDVLETTEFLLHEAGYYVGTATNGKEAVDYVRANKVKLIFMDIKMPIMDGIDASCKIYGIDPKIKVILTSSYAVEIEQLKKVKYINLVDVIEKPFETDNIIAKINEHID